MRKRTFSSIAVAIIATVLLLTALVLPASAAVSLKNATVTLSATTYTYTGKAIKPTVTVKVNKKTVSSKNYTVSYKNNTAVGKGTVTVKGKGSYTGSVSKSFYITPKKVSSLKSTSYSTKIKLSWGKVTGATGYQVYQYKSGSWTKLKNVTGTSYTVSGLTGATTYKFRVRAYAKSGSKYLYSNSYTTINATTTLGKVTSFTVTKAEKETVSVKWGKVTSASSYKLYLVNEETGEKKTLATSGVSYTFTDLDQDTQYSLRIRAYNKTKDIYGGYSDYFYFNTAPANVTGFTVKASGTNAVLSWNKVSGATGYEIQMCTYDALGNEGQYVKLATTKGSSYTVANLTPYESYSFRIRAYITGDVTAYGDFVKSSRITALLSKPVNLSATTTNSSATLSWNAVAGAQGYIIYLNGSVHDAVLDSTTMYTADDLSSGTSYSFGVSAFYKSADGKTHESEIALITAKTDDTSVKSIEILSKPTAMSIGETATVSVRVLPEYAANKEVKYLSSNTSVATIDDYGTITAVSTGTTTITVKSADGKKSTGFNLTVGNVISTSITVPSAITVYLNEWTKITPTFKPDNVSNKNYTVTSSDYTYTYKKYSWSSATTVTCKASDYLYITSDGLIKGLKVTTQPEGEKKEFAFTITVKAADSGKTATTKVTVKERKMKLTYSGDSSPWYYGNSAQLSVELGTSISSKYTTDNIRYKSSDTSIAKVDSKGLVSCVGSGDVSITAYTMDNAYSDTYSFYVRGIIKADSDFFEGCTVGATYNIKASLVPSNTGDTLVYRLADTSTDVISLNTSTGAVKFLKAGSASVIVTSKSGTANTKQIWFTSKTATIPSNTQSKLNLMKTMKDKADSVKSADYLPGYFRTDSTSFSSFKITEKSTSGIIKEDDLKSMFSEFSAPRSTQQNPGGDWQTFNANVPVGGQMVTIIDGLDASEVKSVKVVDDGSYTYDMVMTLESEYFSSLPTLARNSAHGKVFDILTSAYLSEALSEINNSSSGVKITYDAFTQRYHDSVLTLTVNKMTGNVTRMVYDMNVDIGISGLKMKYSSGLLNYTYEADMSFSCNNVIDISFYGYQE